MEELQNQNEGLQIVQNEEGKYVRKANYNFYSSVDPQSKEEKIKLYKLLNENLATPFNDVIGSEITIADVITNPYTSVDEDTGEVMNGVLTYLIDHKGNAFVTSSKSTYFSLINLFKAFGHPHYNEDEAMTVKIVQKKGNKNKYTTIELKG